ncbi:hypothetical protein QW71_27765 [Paenibacillus sp. IHB B 3415]|uniref:hypothetical protein n=1 Tax=Paenibacillus sp. IHB B 3415 TaxID=867080 RepID=UPI00057388CD|nr:hypothetical protein [Paenibacillus sp. IHB B 3415]KHL92725.1 hypothetical protein QW71_27765 [Paenibacillus sp. IHB B 3415]
MLYEIQQLSRLTAWREWNVAFHTTIFDLGRLSEENVVFGAGFCVTQPFKSVPLAEKGFSAEIRAALPAHKQRRDPDIEVPGPADPDIEVPGPAAVWYEFSVCV